MCTDGYERQNRGTLAEESLLGKEPDDSVGRRRIFSSLLGAETRVRGQRKRKGGEKRERLRDLSSLWGNDL